MTQGTQIQGAAELQRRIRDIQKRILPERMKKLLTLWGMHAVGDAKSHLNRPGKGNATGQLIRSIGHEVTGVAGDQKLTVGTGIPYAPFVEGYPRPPRRHFLPFKGNPTFAYWAKRILGLTWSQIDTRSAHKRIARWSSIARHTRSIRPDIPWQRRTHIKGFMVGGLKSIRPFLGPSLRTNIPKMITELHTLKEGLTT